MNHLRTVTQRVTQTVPHWVPQRVTYGIQVLRVLFLTRAVCTPLNPRTNPKCRRTLPPRTTPAPACLRSPRSKHTTPLLLFTALRSRTFRPKPTNRPDWKERKDCLT